MKSIRYYSHILLATIILMTCSALMAQDEESEMKKQKAIQEEEIKRQKEIQVWEMRRQKEIQEEEMRIRKEMLEEQREQMKQMEQQHDDQMRDMEFRARESSRARSVIRSSGVNPEGVYLIESFGQDNQSQLTLRKNFRGTSTTSKGEFEVEKQIKHFRCLIRKWKLGTRDSWSGWPSSLGCSCGITHGSEGSLMAWALMYVEAGSCH